MIDDPTPQIRAALVREILAVASRTNFCVAAHQLGIDTPRLSDLTHGRIGRFSVQRLIRMLARVDRRVEVRVVEQPADWQRSARAGLPRGAPLEAPGGLPRDGQTAGRPGGRTEPPRSELRSDLASR